MQGETGGARIDESRQRQARHYASIQRWLSLVDLLLTAVIVGVFLFTPLGFALRDALAPLAAWQPVAGSAWAPIQVGVYFLVLYGISFVVGLPLSFYSGFTLPHRYGLSTQKLGGWVLDVVKSLALSLVLALAAVELVYLLLAVTPNWWWLWVGIIMLLFTVVMANLAPILLLPIFNKLTPLPEGEVRDRLLALAKRMGVAVGGIYSMDMSVRSTAANAFVIGLGNTRRIVIGDTLLRTFTPDEIEVVMAHELGHQVHHDIAKLVAVQTLVTLGGLFVVNLVLHAVVGQVSGYHGLADAATMPLIGAALGVFGLVVLPLTNGFSRWVEHQADVYALKITGDVQGFLGAMTRLANQNLAEEQPPAWVEFLLYSHPSIGHRLEFGRQYAAAHGEQAA
jgi:STE24 endopeptidase